MGRSKSTVVNEEEGTSVIQIVSKKDFNAFVKSGLERGSADYEQLVKESGTVYLWDHFFDENGYHIGDKISMDLLDGERKVPLTLKITGSANAHLEASWAMTEETFKKLRVKGNLTSEIYISCLPEKKDGSGKTAEEI